MKLPTARVINMLGLLICLVLLAMSYYFQFNRGMDPCLLCLLQRWMFFLSAIIFFIAALHRPHRWGVHVYGILSFITAVAGIIASSRQVWLQHTPLRATKTCIPGVNFLLQTRPLPEVLGLMLHGGRDCSEVAWRWLGLSMPEWAWLFFMLLAMMALVQIFRPTHQRGSNCA